MNLASNNFGLSGQQHRAYDSFFCLTKKCRERKSAKLNAKMEKKEAKTDAMRAETERVRAETAIMTSAAAAEQAAATMPMTQQSVVSPDSIAPQGTVAPPVQKAGLGGNTMMIVVGLVLVGGFLIMKNKKAQVPPQPVRPVVSAV